MNNGKKIKILFAVGRLSVGGAEKLLIRQLPVINRRIFEPHLLTLFPEQKDSFQDQLAIEERWQKFNFRSLFDFPEWFKLFRFFRKEKFDAVVTSLFSANLIARMTAVLAGVPVIVSYEHNFYPDKKQWQIWADWLLAKKTKAIIVDAEAVRTFTAEQEKIPIEKFKTIYVPPLLNEKKVIDSGGIRRKLGIPEDAKVILTVSRLVEEKGHRYIIEAAEKILARFKNVYFVIVGWGPLEKSLQSQIKSRKLENNVILPGKMDIQEVLPAADIYVDPVITIDLPVAIMEAMRLGKAIVASAVGEIPKFIPDGQAGLLVPPANADLLAEKILTLLENDSLRKQFGLAAAEVAKKYSLENYEKEFENFILSFIKKYQ